MNDETALLAAILGNSGDDTVRLVYADWLQENGKPERARAIRAHVRAHHESPQESRVVGLRTHYFPPTEDPENWHSLMNVVTAVTSNPDLNGLSETVASFAAADLCEWSRGFVDCFRCAAIDWIEEGDTVLREQPVTRVALSTPTFGANESHAWLDGDKAGRRFAWSEIDQVVIADAESLDVNDLTALQLLVLRWPGVDFELSSA